MHSKEMFSVNKKIHFVGIGGVGMSALALLLLSQGCKVSGSDLKTNTLTRRLFAKGAEIQLKI